jgi:hypothetical protein
MNDKMKSAMQALIPFLLIGMAIALLLGLLFMFSYVLVWGLIIGGVLWLVTVIKNFFFPSKQITTARSGRVIDHNHKE